MLAFAITDKGMIRDNNQDYYFISEDLKIPLFIVADGMGGHKAGEIASEMVVENIKEQLYKYKDKMVGKKDILFYMEKSIKDANSMIYRKSLERKDCVGMGTTVTLAFIDNRSIYLGHVGDSRAYLVSGNTINQITEDHSLVNELIKNGDITKEEAKKHPQKNLITRAVGTEETIEVDTYIKKYHSGDRLLLCSDGLTNMVDEKTILEVLNRETDIKVSNKKLVDIAKENGGLDNITLITINL